VKKSKGSDDVGPSSNAIEGAFSFPHESVLPNGSCRSGTRTHGHPDCYAKAKSRAQSRSDPNWRNKYFHLVMRRGRKTAKVAMAQRLAIFLYWMWRQQRDYEQLVKFGSYAGQPGNRDDVKHRDIDWASRSPSVGSLN
jgi:hypothetical protein